MDNRESRGTEEVDRLKWLTSDEVEPSEPQPCRHADDQSEASAFPHGAVYPRRVTNSRGSRGNYMNACHET